MWLRIYTQRLHVFVFILVCKYLRICPQSLGGCVCGYVYTHRDCMCLCSYRYTELHILCIFAYMYVEFTWMCVHGMIISACTHVRGTG